MKDKEGMMFVRHFKKRCFADEGSAGYSHSPPHLQILRYTYTPYLINLTPLLKV